MAVDFDDYLPFDTGDGAVVDEDRWRDMARHWLESGVLRSEDNKLAVTGDSSGYQCKVATGKVWIRGHLAINGAIKTVPVTVFSGIPGGQTRKDLVVARADFTNDVVVLDVKAGTPSATPAVPALTQTSTVWEIPLAILGPFGPADTTVEAGDVTDCRLWAVPTHGAGGVIARSATVTTGQSGLSGEQDLTSMTATTYFQTTRRYGIHLRGSVQSTVANDEVTIRIKPPTGGAYFLRVFTVPATSARWADASTTYEETPSSGGFLTTGLQTFKASVQRTTGTGTLTFAGANDPGYFEIIDLGPV